MRCRPTSRIRRATCRCLQVGAARGVAATPPERPADAGVLPVGRPGQRRAGQRSGQGPSSACLRTIEARLESIFVRLVRLGDTGGATRLGASLDDFDPPRRALLQKLGEDEYGRLVSVGATHAELAHEALITQWPWLQEHAEDQRRRRAPAGAIDGAGEGVERGAGREEGELPRNRRGTRAVRRPGDAARRLAFVRRSGFRRHVEPGPSSRGRRQERGTGAPDRGREEADGGGGGTGRSRAARQAAHARSARSQRRRWRSPRAHSPGTLSRKRPSPIRRRAKRSPTNRRPSPPSRMSRRTSIRSGRPSWRSRHGRATPPTLLRN